MASPNNFGADLMIDNTYGPFAETYLRSSTPVLFMILDQDGVIQAMNRFSADALPDTVKGGPFSDIILNMPDKLDLEQVSQSSDTPCQLTISVKKNLPQRYYFHFFRVQNGYLACGHPDTGEMESIRSELTDANQELTAVTKELNRRNEQLALSNKKIYELTRIDPLTQVANRCCFNERIKEMEAFARRHSDPLSLIMTDIDRFKKNINDTFGRDAGDRVLCAYAGLMKSSTRQEDMVARFDGPRFVILLPSTRLDEAYKAAERIRKRLFEMDMPGDGHRLTASFGVSLFKRSEHIEFFIKRADTALGAAKSTGSNKVVCAE
jgi:diguanylate cyclase (GGDEF)-like protein